MKRVRKGNDFNKLNTQFKKVVTLDGGYYFCYIFCPHSRPCMPHLLFLLLILLLLPSPAASACYRPAKQMSAAQHGIRRAYTDCLPASVLPCLPKRPLTAPQAIEAPHRSVLAGAPSLPSYTLNRHNEPNKNTPSNAAQHLNWAKARQARTKAQTQIPSRHLPTYLPSSPSLPPSPSLSITATCLQLPQHLKCQIRLNYLTLRRRRRQFMRSSGEILIGIDSPPTPTPTPTL